MSAIQDPLHPIQDRKSQPKPGKAFEFLARALEVFGLKYAGQIRLKLREDLHERFDDIYRAYVEIQQNLQRGITAYQELQFPEAKRVLDTYRSERRSDDQFFQELKKRSYEILPFPQAILAHRYPNYEVLERVEAVRKKALENLFSEDPLDSASREKLLQFYYGAGALVSDSKTVYFHELLKLHNGGRKNVCLPHLPNEEFLLIIQNRNLKICIDPNIAFYQFLIQGSIEEIQKNLSLDFPDFVEEHLFKSFDNESIRSDVCYFTANEEWFYQMDCTELENRPSASLLLSLQIFLYFDRLYELEKQTQEDLFDMIIHRSDEWDPKSFKPFIERKWEDRRQEVFSWGKLDLLMDFKSPDSWPLFAALWGNFQKEHIVELFLMFECREDRKYLLRLYEENLSCFSEAHAQFFTVAYREILKVVDIEEKETLFLNPPMGEFRQFVCHFGNSPIATNHFVRFMKRHSFPIDARYVQMLRQYILHPSGWLIEQLEQNAKTLGIHTFGEKLLEELFSKSHKPLVDPAKRLLPEQQEHALKLSIEMQESFQFSDLQIFMLYLEIIRSFTADQYESLEQTREFVEQLQRFCPSLEKKDIFFLFFYRPAIDIKRLDFFIDKKEDWIEYQIHRFVVDQSELRSFLLEASQFARDLASVCENELESASFVATFERALHLALAPPVQPLADYFRITNITIDEGIRWGQDEWKTHLGQIKNLSEDKGVYLNWSICNDYPVFFISFVGLGNRAHSVSIPIGVKASEIAQNREPFYSFLGQLAQHFLSEEIDQDFESFEEETFIEGLRRFDGFRHLVNDFHKDIKSKTLTIEHVEKIWDFLREVKVSYRTLYLVGTSPVQSENPMQIAAQGCIYSTNSRISLLPENLLKGQKDVRSYTPTVITVPLYKTLFSKSTHGVKFLDLTLQTAVGDFSIFYFVQTAEELTNICFDGVARRNEVAPPADQIGGRFVTLEADGVKIPLRYPAEALKSDGIFAKYFEYHSLLLKSAVYYRHTFSISSHFNER